MSSVRGSHIPSAGGDERPKAKATKVVTTQTPSTLKEGGKKAPFPGAAKPFTKKGGGGKKGKK